MPTQLLLQNLARYVQLTEAESACFVEAFIPKSLKNKQFLLESGDVCRETGFVVEGCLKGFWWDNNGFEHLLHLAPAGWWIADMYSLLSQQPAQLNLQAIEPSQVWVLPKSRQETLYAEIPKLERFFRILTENSLVAHQQRVMDALSLSAEERYQRFCQRYPELVYRLPQKEIAAYIGVTPEFFSKMRRRLQASGRRL